MNRELATRGKSNGDMLGVLLVGGVIGAMAGVGAAYLLLQARRARRRGAEEQLPLITSSDAVKLGVLLFGLLRQINDIAQGR
jgi:hypothetical protein